MALARSRLSSLGERLCASGPGVVSVSPGGATGARSPCAPAEIAHASSERKPMRVKMIERRARSLCEQDERIFTELSGGSIELNRNDCRTRRRRQSFKWENDFQFCAGRAEPRSRPSSDHLPGRKRLEDRQGFGLAIDHVYLEHCFDVAIGEAGPEPVTGGAVSSAGWSRTLRTAASVPLRPTPATKTTQPSMVASWNRATTA